MCERVKNEGAKKEVFQNHRYCQLCLRVSANGVCNPFQVIRHILKFVNWLIS